MNNKKSKSKKENDGFTMVPNDFLWNRDLKLEEKAMLIILHSNAEHWKTRITEIYTRSFNGEVSQRSVVKNLIEKGYVTRTKLSNGNKFDYHYNFSFSPSLITSEFNPPVAKPPSEKPQVGNATVETTSMENTPMENIDTENGLSTGENPSDGNPPSENPHTESSETSLPPVGNMDTNNTNVNNTNPDNTKEIKRSKRISDTENEVENTEEFNPPTKEEVLAYFESLGSNASAALAFFSEFNQRDWFTVKGDKITNWKGMANYFVKNKSNTVTELSAEDKEGIKKMAEDIYIHMYKTVYKDGAEDDVVNALRIQKSEINSCLIQYCINNKIYTCDALWIKLKEDKINANSMKEFKQSLGLYNEGLGTRYV